MQRILTLAVCLLFAQVASAGATPPSRQPLASDAHRAGPGGTYGGLKNNAPPRPSVGSRNNAGKQPYYYRYYSDTDRSPGSCRRYAQRAIETKNNNWWTRYRACLK